MNTRNKRMTISLVMFFIVVCTIFLIPLAALFLSSLRPGNDILREGLNFSFDWSTASFNNYVTLFTGDNSYFTWYKNSFIILIVQLILSLTLCAVVAYAFAVYDFKLKNTLFTLVLITMMVPLEIIMLPLYQEMISLELLDTHAAIILPSAIMPALVFFFRQYIAGIPRDFVDAARVDGATEYGIFARIMIPLMKPSFAAMGIYLGMQSWNNFLWPLIVIRSDTRTTLPVGLAGLLSPYGNNYDLLIAGSCFALLPVLVLFFAFQKYFIEGMTAGGVKG